MNLSHLTEYNFSTSYRHLWVKRYADPGGDSRVEIKSSTILLDMTGISVLMSDEANNEIAAHLQDPLSMVNATGHLIRNVGSDRLAKFTFFCMTYHDLEQGKNK